jgi:cysteinyl-tRNA synthetase
MVGRTEHLGIDSETIEEYAFKIDEYLGLGLAAREDITESQKSLIREREAARQSNDWPKSDQLRDKLAEQGLEVSDTQSGPVWSRA